MSARDPLIFLDKELADWQKKKIKAARALGKNFRRETRKLLKRLKNTKN